MVQTLSKCHTATGTGVIRQVLALMLATQSHIPEHYYKSRHNQRAGRNRHSQPVARPGPFVEHCRLCCYIGMPAASGSPAMLATLQKCYNKRGNIGSENGHETNPVLRGTIIKSRNRTGTHVLIAGKIPERHFEVIK